MARTLFDHKNYSQASRAFERAKMPRQRDIAGAYYLREMARRTSRTNSTSTSLGPKEQAFLIAAQAFCLFAELSRSQKEKFGPGTLLVRQQQVVVKQTIEDSSQAIEGYKMVEHLKDSVGAEQLHSNRRNNL